MQDRGGSCACLSQAKEQPAIPARAGDGACDGRERLIGSALIFVTIARDGHDMLDALIFAQQPCAGDRALILPDATQGDVAAINLLAQRLQPRDGFWLQATISQFLNAIGDAPFQKAPVIGRWLCAIEAAPLLLQVADIGLQQRGKSRWHVLLRDGGDDERRWAWRAWCGSFHAVPFLLGFA